MIIINNKMQNAGNTGNTKQLEQCCHKGFTDWLHLYAKSFASAKAPFFITKLVTVGILESATYIKGDKGQSIA